MREAGEAKLTHLLVFSIFFALFVGTKNLCDVCSVQCARYRLMTMKEEVVVWTILPASIHGASKAGF